ncbi:hypothetical protein ACH4E8_03860 [Streptomyces sp. NPDC017979]|uniref:hypothetical protein n=1 Tax=Streptomyces sp. NPDC017979 TaxID=3365024 RepID=UPI0037A213A7
MNLDLDENVHPHPYVPTPGDVVLDAATHKVGRVMDQLCQLVQLRPLGGGLEWDASPHDLTPVPATEPRTADALRAAVAQVNAASRRNGGT